MAEPRPTVRSRDGGELVVRPIRASDDELLRAGFERLSADSRYRRFLAPVPRLTEGMVDYLTHVDHHEHEALVAVDRASGAGVGVARYVRTAPEVAEAAVTVVDDWQGRGVGTALLELLALRAREEGIERFTALLLPSNDDMLELLRDLGPVRVLERGEGALEVEVELPESGIGPHLRTLLRAVAAGDAVMNPRSPAARSAQSTDAAAGEREETGTRGSEPPAAG